MLPQSIKIGRNSRLKLEKPKICLIYTLVPENSLIWWLAYFTSADGGDENNGDVGSTSLSGDIRPRKLLPGGRLFSVSRITFYSLHNEIQFLSPLSLLNLLSSVIS